MHLDGSLFGEDLLLTRGQFQLNGLLHTDGELWTQTTLQPPSGPFQPAADLDDVLRPFIIGLDARTKPYDMHLAIFGFDGWTDYRTIGTPTMLLCGDGDFFVNSERLDYTCTLFPDCEIHPLIPGAGETSS